MQDGIILIDKPAHMTSFGVVARLRRVLTENPPYGGCKKIKVGHTGTLDPFATGLMIVVVGKECKNASKYSKLGKTYEATIRLGQISTTGDPEGKITDVSDDIPDRTELENALKKFIGKTTQRPPIFSAIKIDGQRAYKLARDGEKIDMPKRQVEIYSLDLIDYKYPEVKIKTHVSSGTYIRSLAEDIGKLLEVGAFCVDLKRTEIDGWKIDDAHKLSDFGIND